MTDFTFSIPASVQHPGSLRKLPDLEWLVTNGLERAIIKPADPDIKSMTFAKYVPAWG